MHQIVACLFHCIENLIENKTWKIVIYSTGVKSKRIRERITKRNIESIEISRDKIFENGRFRSESMRNKDFEIIKEIV